MTLIDQSPLSQGIAAARANQRNTARTLLLQALEQDERNEQAWLWLSGVMDTPEEQRICLENVLEINPLNTPAQQGLEWLNANHPRPSQTLAADAASTQPSPGAPNVALSQASSDASSANEPPPAHEQPCPFCGSGTNGAASRCAKCGRGLMLRAPLQPKRSVWLTIYSLVWSVLAGIVLGGAVLGLLFGNFTRSGARGVAADPATTLGSLLGRLLGYLLVIYIATGLWRRHRPAYVLSVAILGLSLLFSLTGGVAGLIVGGLPILLIGGLAAAAYGNVFPPKLRINTEVVPTTSDAHYNRGISYKNQGMWYLATCEWECAVANSPRDADYRRTLGLAYAQLGKHGSALRELQVAADLRPGDGQIREDIALVERQAQRPATPMVPGAQGS